MSTEQAPAAAPIFSRTNPYPAKITINQKLNQPGSEKDTRHLSIDISGSDLVYHVGDSLAVYAQNPLNVVDELMGKLKLDPAAAVAVSPTVKVPLREALTRNFVLNRVNKKFVKALVEKLPAGEKRDALSAITTNEAALEEYVFTRDYIDVLNEYAEATMTADEFVSFLNKTNPRLYSIASSGVVFPKEVHLTIAVVRYTTHGREKLGLASGYLAEFAGENAVPVYVQPTKHFHLPPQKDTDVIMVGPGTGIAPFRAFLQERAHTGDKGRNWLFFGDQREATDFLYKEELTAYQKSGVLTKLSTAFSRDQAEKIYVQNRMLEAGAELWDWLQKGAYFYVCGDAKRMAKDVHQALIEIARQHGRLTPDKAEEYINVTFTKTEKRYLKDVY